MSEIQVDLTAQMLTFWIAAAVGAALCVGYDLFRVLRLFRRPGRVGLFVQDVLWWMAAAVVTYGLLLVRCKGSVRSFALLGEGLGFVICRGTASRLLMAVARPLAKICRRLSGAVSARIRTLLRPVAGWADRLGKKIHKFFKNLLQRLRGLLYNSHEHAVRKPGKGRTGDESQPGSSRP